MMTLAAAVASFLSSCPQLALIKISFANFSIYLAQQKRQKHPKNLFPSTSGARRELQIIFETNFPVWIQCLIRFCRTEKLLGESLGVLNLFDYCLDHEQRFERPG